MKTRVHILLKVITSYIQLNLTEFNNFLDYTHFSTLGFRF